MICILSCLHLGVRWVTLTPTWVKLRTSMAQGFRPVWNFHCAYFRACASACVIRPSCATTFIHDSFVCSFKILLTTNTYYRRFIAQPYLKIIYRMTLIKH